MPSAGAFHYVAFLAVFIVVLLQTSEAKDYFNIIDKLHNDLLTNYNKQIRPVKNHTDAINVNAGLRLTNLHFDDALAHFSAQGFFLMSWKDPRLTWIPSDYDGLQSIHLPGEILWHPDLEVYNTPGKLNKDRTFSSTTEALVTSDGSVYYVPLSNILSTCHPDLTNWPYDTQVCLTKIGSWTHNVYKMKVFPDDNSTTVNTELFDATNSEWNLIKTSVEVEIKTYPCCPEPYGSLNYKFTIQRKSPSAKFTVVIPTIGIIVLTLITFFIPPTASSKMTIGAVNLILLCAYLIHFDTILPPSSSVPHIVSFLGETVVLVIISMLVSVVTMNLTQKSKRLPSPIQKFLSSSLGRFLGASRSQKEPNTSDSQQIEKELEKKCEKELLSNGIGKENHFETDEKSNGDWIALSVALHHLMFYIYCITFAVMIQCYLFS